MIVLHEQCFKEGVKAVFDHALDEHYGGRTVLYATLTPNQTIHELFIYPFSNVHQKHNQKHVLEIFSMRWRDPLEELDLKTCLAHELEQRFDLRDKFRVWLTEEGYDEQTIDAIPLGHRYREFSRAFPNRWEHFKAKWREEAKTTAWESFQWTELLQDVATENIHITKEAPICSVIKDASV